MRFPEVPASQVAVVAAASLAAGAGGAAITYGALEHFTTTPAEHNEQVRACADELGEKAVRHVGLPPDCKPFETGFKFHDKWVTVRNTTGTGGLPYFDSRREKIYDRPSADAFREAHLEPDPGDEEKSITRATETAGLLAGFGTLAGMAFAFAKRQREETGS